MSATGTWCTSASSRRAAPASSSSRPPRWRSAAASPTATSASGTTPTSRAGRIADFVRSQGARAGGAARARRAQGELARPWYGNGPLTQPTADRGDVAWRTVAPTAAPFAEGYSAPRAFERGDFDTVKKAFVEGVRRARGAGFEIIELHGAHGYLLHSFLSRSPTRAPTSTAAAWRTACASRSRSLQRWRKAWDKPLFVRISSIDDVEGGWSLADSVSFARELKKVGVDVIDCSSGGIQGSATAATKTVLARVPGFQLPFSETIRKEAGIATMAVGLILTPQQAEEALKAGRADLIAVGREALFDPNWPAHAAHALGADAEFADWPQQYGWWLTRRESLLKKLGIR